MIIRRIEPMSCAKVGGTLYALLGLVIGVCFSLLSLVGFGALGGSGSSMGALFGVGAIILLPILYGVLGFIFMYITAALYNVAAKFAGGLALEIE
jgi:hypothetical protein